MGMSSLASKPEPFCSAAQITFSIWDTDHTLKAIGAVEQKGYGLREVMSDILHVCLSYPTATFLLCYGLSHCHGYCKSSPPLSAVLQS